MGGSTPNRRRKTGKPADTGFGASGAGDVNARELDADEVDVNISGAGDVEVTALKRIDARISGVGEIDYWGRPEKERTRVSGIGDIDRR